MFIKELRENYREIYYLYEFQSTVSNFLSLLSTQIPPFCQPEPGWMELAYGFGFYASPKLQY